MKNWLFNPFTYIAGARALFIGLGIMAASAFILLLNNGHFDGAIDVHFGAKTTLLNSLLESFIDWACLVLPLYILGLIVSESSIRFIDIAGTLALGRWPLFFVSFLGFMHMPDIDANKASLQELIKVALSPSLVITALVSLPFLVWFIVLLYNAFSVSANVKGGKAIAAFIGGLAIAEILSKVILAYCF